MTPEPRPGAGAWYALGLLALIYALNFLDRQLLTVLAPAIKADLGLGDAQLGLLYGTAFAFFYALLGLPLARLADGWNRVWTVALGLLLWSAMTMGSGLATGLAGLALARIGVGIGEASAAPAAYSMLQDLFAPRRRATAIALYSGGIFVGAGLAGIVAAPVLAWWGGGAGGGLRGWQAVFLVAGAPGLLVALLFAATVREPVREARPARPFAAMRGDLATLLPPFSLWRLRGQGRALVRNAALLLLCLAAIAPAVRLTGLAVAPAKAVPFARIGPLALTANGVQWTAVALAAYAALSWLQRLAAEDRVAARLLLGTPAARRTIAAVAVQNIANYAFAAFSFLLGTQRAGLGAGDAALFGVLVTLGGVTGTAAGGALADAVARRHPAGRLWVAAACAALSIPAFGAQLLADTRAGYLAAFVVAQAVSTLWFGPVSAAVQGLVLPRMRGLAAAVQLLAISLVGLGVGPYAVGLVSDATGHLATGLAVTLPLLALSGWLYLAAARLYPQAAASVEARAAT